MNIYGAMGVLCLVLSMVLVIINIRISKKQKLTGVSLREKKGSSLRIYISLYRGICKIPFLKELLQSIRKRLEIYSASDERNLRKRSVLLLLSSIVAFVTLITLFWIITRDMLLLLLFTVLLAFISDTIIELFINELQNKLLRQQLRYLELLRHKYYEQKSVEEANIEACDQLNQKDTFEVYAQAERINDLLSSRDLEEELEKYYETAPNKYFKMLAGIIFITKEYGDTFIKDNSVFVRCVAYLGNEIKAELHKRQKLKFALRSLNTISLVPLFCLKPLRDWAAESFAPLESFYVSKLGIILGIVTVLASVCSYIILRRLQRFDRALKPGYVKPFVQKIYDSVLHGPVDRLVPKEHTETGNYMKNLIKSAMAQLNTHTLYTQRVIVAALAFIFGITMFVGINAYSNHVILYKIQMPQGYLGGKLSEEERIELQAITDYDRSIILGLTKYPGDDAIIDKINEKGGLSKEETDIALNRIRGKIHDISNNIFWFWQLLLSFVILIAGYHSPVIALQIIAKAKKIDMEDEVTQFQTIILMLMHMNRIHVQELLEWMETFSVHFQEPLQKCLLNFDAGPQESLEQLKEEVNFPPFVKLIENLQLGCSDLEVSKAFEELENEMSFNIETRKENNERIVERKKNLGSTIGFVPIYSLILFYLIIPMIVSGTESLTAFYNQLSQF